MAWIEIGLIFLGLLILYQRFSVGGLVAFVALIAVVGGIVWLQASWQQAAEDKVVLAFRYDPKGCPSDQPIFASITNGSDRTVASVFFDIVLRRRGFSDESGRVSSIRSDKILKPGESFTSCHRLPSLSENIDPNEIDFSVGYKVIKFAD